MAGRSVVMAAVMGVGGVRRAGAVRCGEAAEKK